MFVVGYGVPWQEACALRPALKACAPCIKLGFMHLPWMVPSISHYPFLQSIYLSSLFLSCPSFSLSFIQVDKLDASESLRKEEEQLTEAQPIVYGRTPTLPFHLRKKNFYNSTTSYWLSNMVFIWLIQISRSHLFILLIFYFRFYFKLLF